MKNDEDVMGSPRRFPVKVSPGIMALIGEVAQVNPWLAPLLDRFWAAATARRGFVGVWRARVAVAGGDGPLRVVCIDNGWDLSLGPVTLVCFEEEYESFVGKPLAPGPWAGDN